MASPHQRTQALLNRCTDCRAIVSANLIGACASVGIEAKKSTDQMLLEYLNAYHRGGHRTPTEQLSLHSPV